jgi:hypothetical protein
MSTPGMQEPPGYGADPVEELQGVLRRLPFDGAGRDEQLQMAIDLLGGAVGDPPQVRAVAAGAAVAFGEVRPNRAGRANQLVGDRLGKGPGSTIRSLNGGFAKKGRSLVLPPVLSRQLPCQRSETPEG